MAPRAAARAALRLAFAVLLLGATAAWAQRQVTFCADPDPPPNTWERDAKGQKTGRLVGMAVDLARAAFANLGMTVTFIGDYPWARCVKLVEEGQIDFAAGAYWDAERATRFTYTRAFWHLTPHAFFDTRRPVAIKSLADLRKYRGCGLAGNSYAHYGLGADDLDLGVNTFQKLYEKLRAGRCDYFLDEIENFSGMKIDGQDALKLPDLGYAPVPGAREPASHFITRKGGTAEALVEPFNRQMTLLIDSGRAREFWRVHGGPFPYRP